MHTKMPRQCPPSVGRGLAPAAVTHTKMQRLFLLSHRRGDSRIARGRGYEDAEAMPLCRRGGVSPPAAVGLRRCVVCLPKAKIYRPPFEGGIKGGCLRITTKLECCETDKALISIFVCINTPPYPRAASLPQGEGNQCRPPRVAITPSFFSHSGDS